MRHYLLIAAVWTLPLIACAADFTGSWTSTDRVCKRACTDEEPEPDFEIRVGIVLIQRGLIVCGIRNQNTMSDSVVLIPLRGVTKGSLLELEAGAELFDEEPAFPFKVSLRTTLQLKGRTLAETFMGRAFAKHQRAPFLVADQKQYLSDNKAFFDACFSASAPAKR